jgi:hypothetical protein
VVCLWYQRLVSKRAVKIGESHSEACSAGRWDAAGPIAVHWTVSYVLALLWGGCAVM